MRLYDREVNRFNYKNFNTADLEKFKSMLKSNIKDIDEKKDVNAFELQDRYDMNELYMYITIELNSRFQSTHLREVRPARCLSESRR